MKIKIIDYLKALNENRIKEGFRFVYDNKVFEVRKIKDTLVAMKNGVGNSLGYCYDLESDMYEEIEIITPELIEPEKIKLTVENISFGIDLAKDTCEKTTITQRDIDEVIKKSIIKAEKLGDKTTIVTVVLPNGFVLVKSSSCIDPKNFDMKIGKEICMKKITDKIWELEGYKLQSAKGDE